MLHLSTRFTLFALIMGIATVAGQMRGSGGTTRLVLLPHEDHGYRARESVEHVPWKQLRWFDMYVKGAGI